MKTYTEALNALTAVYDFLIAKGIFPSHHFNHLSAIKTKLETAAAVEKETKKK